MDQTIHIKASDGTDFYQQIATFAYGSCVLHGSGAVIVTEGEFRVHGEGRVEAALTYIPFSQDADLPDEVIEQINDYDPELQCVFAMVDSEGKATVLTLNAAEHMGSTPKMLFEEAIKRQQHVPILPGIVVRLKDCVGDIEPGWFVFLGEEKSDMILSRAGEDDDGDVVAAWAISPSRNIVAREAMYANPLYNDDNSCTLSGAIQPGRPALVRPFGRWSWPRQCVGRDPRGSCHRDRFGRPRRDP